MIIGITGTNGAGKGTVVDYLVSKKGFKHYSARALIVEEIERRGLPVDRSSMNLVGNDLRTKHGPAYIAETYAARAKEEGVDAVIESIRVVAEAVYIKEHGGKILVVDADPKVRYERVVLRGSSTDKVDFETFLEQERREMDAKESWNMNIGGVMQMADLRIENNGTLEELHKQIERAFAQGQFASR